MRNNAALDFVINDHDIAALNAVEHTDCGDAAAMPVFGSELNLKSMASMALSALRR